MARTKRKTSPDLPLLGSTEAALLLGWDRKRVSLYLSRGKFPTPSVVLASGPVWQREDLVAYAHQQGMQLFGGVPNDVEPEDKAETETPADTVVNYVSQPDRVPLELAQAQTDQPTRIPQESTDVNYVKELDFLRRENQQLEADLQRVRGDYLWSLKETSEKAKWLKERDKEVHQLRKQMERMDTKLVPADLKVTDEYYNTGTSQAVRALLEHENIRHLELAHEMAVLVDRWDKPTYGNRFYVSRSAISNAIDKLCLEAVERRMQGLGRALAKELQAKQKQKLTSRERQAISRTRYLIKRAYEVLVEGDSIAKSKYRVSEKDEVEEQITHYLKQGEDGRPLEEWRPVIRLL